MSVDLQQERHQTDVCHCIPGECPGYEIVMTNGTHLFTRVMDGAHIGDLVEALDLGKRTSEEYNRHDKAEECARHVDDLMKGVLSVSCLQMGLQILDALMESQQVPIQHRDTVLDVWAHLELELLLKQRAN